MAIEIMISNNTINRAEELLKLQLPSTFTEIWHYFQELSDCLWQIRVEINDFIDDFPKRLNYPVNFRFDSCFDDYNVKSIEDSLSKRMDECSDEAKRIEKEKEIITLKLI